MIEKIFCMAIKENLYFFSIKNEEEKKKRELF